MKPIGLHGLFLALAFLVGSAMAPAHAAPITLTPSVGLIELMSGDQFVVTGTITNISGFSLLTSDLVLSVSGYPFDWLEITPLLGDPAVTIPDRTISAALDLFQLTALPGLVGDLQFDLSFFIEDINGNLSDPVSVAVTLLDANNVVPEPASLVLVMAALVLAAGVSMATRSLGLTRTTGGAANREV